MASRDERGAAALEWALLAPLFVLILGVTIAGWRLADARSGVAHAAEAGARAASLERTAAAASGAAERSASMNLARTGCASPVVRADLSGFSTPVGRPASVSVSVSCRVSLADLLVPGLPGSIEVDSRASAPLDRYRSRG